MAWIVKVLGRGYLTHVGKDGEPYSGDVERAKFVRKQGSLPLQRFTSLQDANAEAAKFIVAYALEVNE